MPGTFAYIPGSGTVLNAGDNQTLTANFTPNDTANYNNASKSVSINVAKKGLTVTAEDKTATFGQSLPANSATYDGFVNGDDENDLGGTLGFAYNPANPQNAGTYDIVPSGLTSSNYEISYVNGTLTIERAPGSVEITNIPNDAVFGGNFTPDISASGDGQTSVESLTASTCEVSNAGVVDFVGVGQCTLRSSVAQGTNYDAATNEQSFQIAKAHATLTLSDLTGHTYNGSPQGATVTTDPAGLQGVNVTYDGSTDEPTNAGSYPVVASLDNPNYEADNATGTLVIDKASLTVEANSASRKYGEANPTFTGTLTGVVNGDDITASYSTAATQASDWGTYDIVPEINATASVLANYQTPVLTNGTLTVTKADAVEAKANSASREYGEANPTFTGTLTGVKNNDAITASYSSAATQASDWGTYSIVTSLNDPNGKLGNYEAPVLTNGTLTVTKAPLTIKADNASTFLRRGQPDLHWLDR